MYYQKLLRAILTPGLLRAGLLTVSVSAFGASTSTRGFDFAPVGLAPTETVQINVVNVASNSSSGTAASCSGTISFLDATGSTIGTATAFTVTSGQVFSASLPHSSTGASGRSVIRGLVELTVSSSSQAPCALESSLETFDTTSGVTHLMLAGPGFGVGGPGPFGR